jgi:hypothetical protein
MARAIRTGSAARVTAEATNTALQPNSIADIASLDVPIPASRRMTGTLVRSTMSEMLCGLRSRARNRSVSRPACAAQPTCSNRRANAGRHPAPACRRAATVLITLTQHRKERAHLSSHGSSLNVRPAPSTAFFRELGTWGQITGSVTAVRGILSMSVSTN